MYYQELAREKAYWVYDKIRGSKVTRHYNELQDCLNARNHCLMPPEKGLQEFLSYACQNTEFYKKFKGHDEILEFPVMNRDIIKQSYNDMMSYTFKNKPLKYAITSGSTGTPFHCPMSSNKWARRMAEVIYFNNLAGFCIGMKHLDIVNKKKNKLLLSIQNAKQFDSKIIDEEWLEKIHLFLARNTDIKAVISFVSTFEMLANYYSSKTISPSLFNFDCLILKGEPLFVNTRELLKNTFNCNVYSRYASEELGVLAQSCKEKNMFHLNTASYIFEVLSLHNNEPAHFGEPGRLIITDIYSHAFPLIRYDIGDIVELSRNCTCGKDGLVLKYIEGRSIDVINNTKGDYVSPFIINRIMKNYRDIMQFQFIQVGKSLYRVIVYEGCGFNRNRFKSEADKTLKKILGVDAIIEYVFHDTIPYSASGKRSYIINNYQRQTNYNN